jgi:DNA-binding NarL/FixJ family response regulator
MKDAEAAVRSIAVRKWRPEVLGMLERGGYSYALVRFDANVLRSLSPRQMEVALCIRRGRANKEIARELGLKMPRVAALIAEVKWRLRVGSRSEVAIVAFFLEMATDQSHPAGPEESTRPS